MISGISCLRGFLPLGTLPSFIFLDYKSAFPSFRLLVVRTHGKVLCLSPRAFARPSLKAGHQVFFRASCHFRWWQRVGQWCAHERRLKENPVKRTDGDLRMTCWEDNGVFEIGKTCVLGVTL